MKNIGILSSLLLLVPHSVFAHAFGQNFTLPIPVWLYLYAGAAVVLVSFLFMMLFELRRKSNPQISAVFVILHIPQLVKQVAQGSIFACALIALVVAIGATLRGGGLPSENFSSLFIWIIFFLGMTYLSMLLGNIWRFIDPLRTILTWLNLKSLFMFPLWMRYLPALLGYVFFIWLELLSGGRAAEPDNLFYLLIGYITYTIVGVLLYGVSSWYAFADVWSVYFAIIARSAPIEYARGHVTCKVPFSTLTKEIGGGMPLALFVFFMLSSTAFDGFRETKWWLSYYHMLLPKLSFFGESVSVVVPSIALIISPFAFFALYALALYVAKLLTKTEYTVRFLMLRFVGTLIPIAIGYNIAHYFTLLLIQGQSFVVVLSDPFHLGWDLFGTSSMVPNIGIVGVAAVWHTQVIVIILAHVIAIILAHYVAIDVFKTKKVVLISQLPVLVLMVLYTLLGLWILSLPMGIA